VAQLPVHFDVVEVSGANQYKVKPLALVRTVAPPIVVVFSADPEAAGADVLVPVVPVELAELPHAAIRRATAAVPISPKCLVLM
jgi:hypothetical protein